jgi:hypothetical protein
MDRDYNWDDWSYDYDYGEDNGGLDDWGGGC